LLGKYKNDIKLVFKNFPLPMHPFARPAAAAAQAALRQGKFREFHHKLFEMQNSLSEETIRKIAQELKLNMETFERDRNDPAIQSIIARDMNEGQKAEIPGTPTLFVNGKLVQLRSLQDIDIAIEAELKKKNKQ
jgi:protein-disulfide isomerase